MVGEDLLGRLLELLESSGGASDELPVAPGLDPGEGLVAAQVMLDRGWITAEASLAGDGRLFAIRRIRVTSAGKEALRSLRSTSTRDAKDIATVLPIDEKRARRFQFMNRLYDATNGSKAVGVSMWDLGAELGWSRADTDGIVEYLAGEQLVDFVAMGGTIGITHAGVVEVEQALASPEEPTTHFPATLNIVNVGTMVGSQVQQGTDRSEQVGTFSLQEVSVIREAVTGLRRELSEVKLAPDDEAELNEELATLDLQLSSKRPKPGRIRESVGRITELLSVATVASGSTVVLAEHIDKLRQIVGL